MRRVIGCLTAVSCILYGSLAFAQLPQAHTLTYAQKARSVGSLVSINGDQYQIVRMPVADFPNGDKFAISFAASSTAGFLTGATITTVHDNGSTSGTNNITIDGYPATVFAEDGFSYLMQPDGGGGYALVVNGTMVVSITIDIGDTLVTLSTLLNAKAGNTGQPPLTFVNVGTQPNAVRNAQWNKYQERTELIDGADKWIDFIRIVPR